MCAREGNGAENCVNGQLVLVLIQVAPRRNPAPGISPPGQPAIFPFAMKTGALDGDEKTRMLFQRTETMHAYNCPENKIEFIFEAT